MLIRTSQVGNLIERSPASACAHAARVGKGLPVSSCWRTKKVLHLITTTFSQQKNWRNTRDHKTSWDQKVGCVLDILPAKHRKLGAPDSRVASWLRLGSTRKGQFEDRSSSCETNLPNKNKTKTSSKLGQVEHHLSSDTLKESGVF